MKKREAAVGEFPIEELHRQLPKILFGSYVHD